MNIANVKVGNVFACAAGCNHITSGMCGVTVTFEYIDRVWDSLNKTAVFTAGQTTRDVLNADDIVTVPPEVLNCPGERLYVGVYGIDADGNLVIPTIMAPVGIIMPGADPSGDESTEPSLPVWAQLHEEIENLNQNGGFVVQDEPPEDTTLLWVDTSDETAENEVQEAVDSALEQAKENGEFDGKPGENGGYYIPSVTLPSSKTVRFSFSPTKEGMADVVPFTVSLPVGEPGAPGKDYVLTDDDKTEIAAEAAKLVDAPESVASGWEYIDTIDLSSGALSYEFDTTGYTEIAVAVLSNLTCSGANVLWKGIQAGTYTLMTKGSSFSVLRYLGNGVVTWAKPRGDDNGSLLLGIVQPTAQEDNNTLKFTFASVTSGTIMISGRA